MQHTVVHLQYRQGSGGGRRGTFWSSCWGTRIWASRHHATWHACQLLAQASGQPVKRMTCMPIVGHGWVHSARGVCERCSPPAHPDNAPSCSCLSPAGPPWTPTRYAEAHAQPGACLGTALPDWHTPDCFLKALERARHHSAGVLEGLVLGLRRLAHPPATRARVAKLHLALE